MRALMRRTLSLSLAVWIGLLVLAALVPLLGLSLWVLHELVGERQADELKSLRLRAAVTADALAADLRQLERMHRLVTSSPEAQRGDWPAVQALAARVQAHADGILAFRIDAGPAPARSLQLSPLMRREGGALLQAELTGALGGAGTAPHVLRMAIDPALASRALAEQRWPASWTAAVVDQDMQIVARSRDDARQRGQPVTASLATAIRQAQSGIIESQTREGVPVIGVVAAVPGWPWHVAVGIPQADFEAQSRAPLWPLLLLGGAVLGLALAASWLIGRHLTRQARDAACGEAAHFHVHEFQQIDERRRHSASALLEAHHDAITGLPVRRLFFEQLRALRSELAAYTGTNLALLFVDLDGFKFINDRDGHAAGDQLLARVANVLRQHTRQGDLLCRLGGDEFVLVLPAPDGDARSVAQTAGERIVTSVGVLYPGLGCSIGLTVGTSADTAADLLARADAAMYRAKQMGKGRVVGD